MVDWLEAEGNLYRSLEALITMVIKCNLNFFFTVEKLSWHQQSLNHTSAMETFKTVATSRVVDRSKIRKRGDAFALMCP